MDFKDKKVLVFGSGISGIGACELLEKSGATVILFDGNEKLHEEGLPVRGAFNTMSKSEAKKQLGFDENEICVLSTGGSLGARVLNEQSRCSLSICLPVR